MSLEKHRKYIIILMIIILYFVPSLDSGTELSEDVSGFSCEVVEYTNSGEITETEGISSDDYLFFTGFLKNTDNQAYIRKYTFAIIFLLQLAVSFYIKRRKNHRSAEPKKRWQNIIDFIHEKDGTKGKRLLYI